MAAVVVLAMLVPLACAAVPPSDLAIVATQPEAVATPLPAVNGSDNGAMNGSWSCPHVGGVLGISCTCDVPHTVRCRGQADQPHDLTQLISTITREATISLLDLAIHGLGDLPQGAFESMNLLGLIITTAGLTSLPPGAFAGLEPTLTALGLPNNRLTAVPVEAIRGLKHLQRLDLSDNNIKDLPPHAFPTLLQLQNLNLAGNGLQVLQPEAFVRLPHLVSLDLARNHLDAALLNDKTLRGLHALQRLSLQSNLLKGAVTGTLITGARGLTSLDLSDNELTTLSRGALAGCPDLGDLDLSHNHIDVIEDHAFANLSRLHRLQLSHNRVVAVSGWSLAHLPALTHLSLADNALRAVTADLVHQLPRLAQLDLAANDITLLQPHVFNATPDLRHLSLSDNPLHCDCKLEWLWEWLGGGVLATGEEQSAVCATPPPLENAPLVELNKSQLVCSEETSYHDYYHDYFHDYYHDEAAGDDGLDMLISSAEISLVTARWLPDGAAGVELVWRVDERAVPYSCVKVYVYEEVVGSRGQHQVLAQTIDANCTSDGATNPHRVSVTVPGDGLMPGSTYMYCLVLLERGTGDAEAFLPGCSEPLALTGHLVLRPGPTVAPRVASVTAGGVGGHLIVHSRVDGLAPCTYTVAVVAGHRVAATRQLNCSEARHEFPGLTLGPYLVCVDPDAPGHNTDLAGLERRLAHAPNVTAALHDSFAMCTPLTFVPHQEAPLGNGPWLTLLFTLPGLALVVTLYVIARRVWRGGGVPWRWDPRAQKSGKYFLYTGEATPSLSLDPIPADPPESTTPV